VVKESAITVGWYHSVGWCIVTVSITVSEWIITGNEVELRRFLVKMAPLSRWGIMIDQNGNAMQVKVGYCRITDMTELGIGMVYHARALERERKNLSTEPAWSIIGAVETR
jgi:hypothetical protein